MQIYSTVNENRYIKEVQIFDNMLNISYNVYTNNYVQYHLRIIRNQDTV